MASEVTSMRLATFLVRILTISSDQIPVLNSLIRELAHFGGFFVFGGLVYDATWVTWRGRIRPLLVSTLLCIALAILDEVKKIWLPSRHLSWPEAGLNVLGVLCGVMVSLFITWIISRRHQKNPAQAVGAGS